MTTEPSGGTIAPPWNSCFNTQRRRLPSGSSSTMVEKSGSRADVDQLSGDDLWREAMRYVDHRRSNDDCEDRVNMPSHGSSSFRASETDGTCWLGPSPLRPRCLCFGLATHVSHRPDGLKPFCCLVSLSSSLSVSLAAPGTQQRSLSAKTQVTRRPERASSMTVRDSAITSVQQRNPRARTQSLLTVSPVRHDAIHQSLTPRSGTPVPSSPVPVSPSNRRTPSVRFHLVPTAFRYRDAVVDFVKAGG